MRALAIAFLLMACTREQPRRVPDRVAARAPVPAARDGHADRRLAIRKAAHDALAEHCGACHEGHLPTAKPAALAIFDLDQPDWPARFDARRFQVALGRLAAKPAAARDAFLALRDAELAAR